VLNRLRDLHAHPEFGFEEKRTSAFVAAKLREFGLDEVAEGVGGTGVVGTLKRGSGNQAIALRATWTPSSVKGQFCRGRFGMISGRASLTSCRTIVVSGRDNRDLATSKKIKKEFVANVADVAAVDRASSSVGIRARTVQRRPSNKRQRPLLASRQVSHFILTQSHCLPGTIGYLSP
jgi:hypothetical protein